MTCVPLLVIGATFAGVGISSSAKNSALIVEQASLPGHEFISSYRPGDNWDSLPGTPAGKRFRDQLVQRNVLNESGRVHIPAVLPILCQYIKDEQLPLMLMTTVTNIAEHPDGYEVTLQHVSGLQTIMAKQIVDTTARGLFHASTSLPVVRKSINAMLHHPEPDSTMPASFDKSISFTQGGFDSEVILKVELAQDDDWITARQKLHSIWSGRPEHLRPWTIASIADTFETHTCKGPTEIRPNWFRLPSCAYTNLLEAFEEGVLFAKHKGVEHEPIAVDQ